MTINTINAYLMNICIFSNSVALEIFIIQQYQM